MQVKNMRRSAKHKRPKHDGNPSESTSESTTSGDLDENGVKIWRQNKRKEKMAKENLKGMMGLGPSKGGAHHEEGRSDYAFTAPVESTESSQRGGGLWQRRKRERKAAALLLGKLGGGSGAGWFDSGEAADDGGADESVEAGLLALLEQECRAAEAALRRPCRALEFGCGARG